MLQSCTKNPDISCMMRGLTPIRYRLYRTIVGYYTAVHCINPCAVRPKSVVRGMRGRTHRLSLFMLEIEAAISLRKKRDGEFTTSYRARVKGVPVGFVRFFSSTTITERGTDLEYRHVGTDRLIHAE